MANLPSDRNGEAVARPIPAKNTPGDYFPILRPWATEMFALVLLDIKIMKFDAGSEEMFRQVNHPGAPIYMGEIVAGLKELKDILLHSLFVQGRVTNANPDSVGLWVERVRNIRPMRIQVYTLDRKPGR